MISEKEFDRDAAMLASMVGGHLKHVDNVTSDRSQPANRIDIGNFIAPLKGGPAPRANAYDPANRGYIPEQMVQNMAPDISVNLIQNTPLIQNQPNIVQVPQRPLVSNVDAKSFTELEEDIKAIKSTLLKIDGTFSKIAGMLGKVFNHITEKEKINSSK